MMAATLLVFVGLFAFFTLAALAERYVPDRVIDKVLRLFGIEEGL